ncbi:oligosaccharide flippase family protein [Sphingomonas fennica]|uniref:Polysaccharide biosynthesis protein n=1 Tax=Edaphosphingomonas fennica TaxID=114404 RepID=A0A2T4HPD1_9SPHN|nr:oligosaccharide flippase family protein [Sphingomonas fennica]PTD17637.1 hypothetical protein CV103_16725 [Sphingomonas fennica]
MNASSPNDSRGLIGRAHRLATRPSSLILISLGFQNGLRLVSSMILTRLLDTHDFGVMGIIMSWMIVLTMISDIGVYAVVTRHKRFFEPAFLDAIWTFRALRGLVITIAMIVLAGPIASVSAKSEVAAPLAVAALVLLIDGSQSLFNVTAPREGRLAQLTLFEMTGALVQTLFTILLALMIPSYWALVWGYVSGACVKTVASFLLPGAARRPSFDREVFRELIVGGRPFFISSVASVFVRQIDKILLSRFMTLPQFGIYTIASNLTSVPTLLSDNYARRFLYIAYVNHREAQDRPDTGFFLKFGRPFRWLYVAGVGALVGGGEAIVHILYDSRYWFAATYIYLLAPSIFLRLTNARMEQFLLAHKVDAAQMYANLIRAAWIVISLPAAYHWGGQLAMIAALGCVEVPVHVYLSARVHGLVGSFHWRERATAFAVALAAGLVALALSQIGLALVEGQKLAIF